MNPLTNLKNVTKLSENELRNIDGKSWHNMYRDSAWIFVGGLPFTLSEGDVICVFSQFGEVVNINLIRDKVTGKSKGFCFLCYEDQRSTILAVDNLNGMKILDRSIRVDHVADYKPPKDNDKLDDETLRLYNEGCAPKVQITTSSMKAETKEKKCSTKERHKKHRKEKKKSKKRSRRSSSETDSSSSSSSSDHKRRRKNKNK